MGKLQEFNILFDHPQGVYQAGETLQGTVVVRLSEPMKMRNIRLLIKGQGRVNFDNMKEVCHAEEVYLQHIIYLFGHENGDGEMHPSGEKIYSFQVNLDNSDRPMPSSFEGVFGYVRYTAKATIGKPWKFDHVTKTAFTVINQLNLNAEPYTIRSTEPTERYDTMDAGCNLWCLSGEVSVEFTIDRRGYVPGQNILINAKIHNGSNTKVEYTKVALKQNIDFYGRPSPKSTGKYKHMTVKDTVAADSRGEIAAGQTFLWENVPLTIPPLPPSRLTGCKIMDIEYVVKFYAKVNYVGELQLATSVVIGTIPLHDVDRTGTQGVITQQPASDLPPIDYDDPAAPLPTAAPPSYQECMRQVIILDDEEDSKYTYGSHTYSPAYPYYQNSNVADTSES